MSFQVYDIVIHYFYRLFSIESYYKISAVFPVLSIHPCMVLIPRSSYLLLPSPVMPLPPWLTLNWTLVHMKQCLIVVFIFLLDYDVERLFILLVDLIFKEMSTHTFWITYLFFFCLHQAACRILVSWPEMEPMPSALEAQSLNHWTAREFPVIYLFNVE